MPDGSVCDHEKHHDIDARLVLQFEASLRYSGPGVNFKGKCPAVGLQLGPGRCHERDRFINRHS